MAEKDDYDYLYKSIKIQITCKIKKIYTYHFLTISCTRW